MIKLRSRLNRSLVFRLFRIGIALLGCLLFLISFISPFLTISMITLGGGTLTNYWSYKSDYYTEFTGHLRLHQTWFSDYWFSPYMDVGLRIPWILVSVFTLQVFTLLFGVASIIFNRRMLAFAPVYLSLTVLALMIYTTNTLSGMYQFGLMSYGQGYHFSYYAAGLFLSAFVLNEVTK